MPPLAVMACEYAELIVPLVSDDGESTMSGPTVSVSARVPTLPRGSVAVTKKSDAPVPLGVPVTTPADDIERPLGSEPNEIAKVYVPVPPVAATD